MALGTALIQCFSIGLLLAGGLTLHDLDIHGPAPPHNNKSQALYIGPWFNFTQVTFPGLNIFLNDSSYQLQVNDTLSLTIRTTWGSSDDKGVVSLVGEAWFDLELSKGLTLGGRLHRDNKSAPCRPTSYTVDQCDMIGGGLRVSKKNSGCKALNPSAIGDCLLVIPTIESLIDGDLVQPFLQKLLCNITGPLSGAIAKLLIEGHKVPHTALPPLRAGSPPLTENPYIRMANNIVKNLPPLSGVDLSLQLVGDNAVHFGIAVPALNESYNYDNQTNLALVERSIWSHVPGLYDFRLPHGLKVDLDIVIQYFVCVMKTGVCSLSGLALYNLNVRAFNDLDFGLDSLLDFILQDGIDKLFSPPNATTNRNDTINITLIPSKEIEGPPRFVYGLIGIVPAFLALTLMILSIRYHYKRLRDIEKEDETSRGLVVPSGELFIDENGRTVRTVLKYKPWLGILRDFIIILLCGSAMMMFIYANAETAVTVMLGNEVRIFAFSLQNSVHDFWNSGLKALAFFIALFSGAYPYLKLVGICAIAIVHRNTKSKLLRVIDSVGRYSFLDSFVMMVLVTTLQVPGVAEVDALLAFYSFIAATVISMVAGNIATHTYDVGLIVETIETNGDAAPLPKSTPNLNNSKHAAADQYGSITNFTNKASSPSIYADDHINKSSSNNTTTTIYSGTVQKKSFVSPLAAGEIEYGGGHPGEKNTNNNNNNNDDDDFERVANLEKPWLTRPILAILLLIGATAVYFGILYGWIHYPLRYKFAGFVTVLKGEYQDYSLHRLFFESPPMLGIVAIMTIVAAPLLMVTIPHPVVLSYVAPWCSTDVFLLTCLAALLQLHDFIKYQAGPALGGLINASAELHYPFYLVGVSAVFQWVYIVRAAIGTDPNTKRTTSGRPADNQAPPWLLYK